MTTVGLLYNIGRRRNRIRSRLSTREARVAHRSEIRKQGLAQSILTTGITAIGGYMLLREPEKAGSDRGEREEKREVYNVSSRRGAN